MRAVRFSRAVLLRVVLLMGWASTPALAASPVERFTLIMLPDTQIATQTWPELFNAQTQWVVNNRSALNIRYVIHVGDIVEWPVRASDWETAKTAMNRLHSNGVPYVIAIGNHDMDAWPTAPGSVETDRRSSYFNTHFPRSRFTAWGSFGGTYPSNQNDNSFHLFSAGGTDWLILTLKFVPTDAELSWAQSIIHAHPERQVIINTHDYMNGTTRSAAGQRIWNAVKDFPNVALILSGHYVNTGQRVDPGTAGNNVYQLMADYQNYNARDPNSYLKILQFDPVAQTVSVQTYSPFLNQHLTDAANRFTLTGVDVFRSFRGSWSLRDSNSAGTPTVPTFQLGTVGDVPVVGDWNGDGHDTIGIYRPSTNLWHLRNSNTSGSADVPTFSFGNSDDIQLVGDWNGDGSDTIGIYRPSTSTFFLRNSNSSGAHDVTFTFGSPGDVPLVGDWNGDGIDTLGVYRPSTNLFYLRNSLSGGSAELSFSFGGPTDVRVVGDWNGDGKDTVGVYRQATWFLRNSLSAGPHDVTFVYGSPKDWPLAGDWDGDGIDTIGTAR